MREIIYPSDDQLLAATLKSIDRDAQRTAFQYDGWDGYTEDVYVFIQEQGVRAESSWTS